MEQENSSIQGHKDNKQLKDWMCEYKREEEDKKKEFLELYENILWEEIPRGNDILLDPRKIVPIEFDSIRHYIKQLGNEPIDVKVEEGKFTVIFEGGHVTYWEHSKSNKKTYIPIHSILYGVTVAPGKRSAHTQELDTHIVFGIENRSEITNLEPNQFYIKELDIVMDIAVFEPEDTNIRDYWVKE